MVVFVNVPVVKLVFIPVDPPVIPPVMEGILQVYVVPTGIVPVNVGVKAKEPPQVLSEG